MGYELFERGSEVMMRRLQAARVKLSEAMKKPPKMSSDNQKIEQRVAAHPFLKGIAMDHIRVLAQSAVPTRFEKDQVIFKAGEPANGFYLIESGTVALEGSVFDRGPVTTDVVSAGEPLGWSWLFPPYLWHFDARATEPTTALCFSGVLLRQHRDEDPALSHELFKRACEVMARRLQAARSKLLTSGKATSREHR